jgi:hypothetical protein
MSDESSSNGVSAYRVNGVSSDDSDHVSSVHDRGHGSKKMRGKAIPRDTASAEFSTQSRVKKTQEFANTFVQRTGRHTTVDLGTVNTNRRRKYAQSLLAHEAKTAPTEEKIDAVLCFPVGRRLFPKTGAIPGPERVGGKHDNECT